MSIAPANFLIVTKLACKLQSMIYKPAFRRQNRSTPPVVAFTVAVLTYLLRSDFLRIFLLAITRCGPDTNLVCSLPLSLFSQQRYRAAFRANSTLPLPQITYTEKGNYFYSMRLYDMTDSDAEAGWRKETDVRVVKTWVSAL